MCVRIHVPTHTHSCFSRVAEAEQFQRLTLGELYRRGVETVDHVAVLSDGAKWIQGYIDFHAPNARRILDFPHGTSAQKCDAHPAPAHRRGIQIFRLIVLLGWV